MGSLMEGSRFQALLTLSTQSDGNKAAVELQQEIKSKNLFVICLSAEGLEPGPKGGVITNAVADILGQSRNLHSFNPNGVLLVSRTSLKVVRIAEFGNMDVMLMQISEIDVKVETSEERVTTQLYSLRYL